MTVDKVIESVEQLSDSEKLIVIEAIARMVRKSIATSQMLQQAVSENGVRSVAEVAAPYMADRLVMTESDTDLNFDLVSDKGLDALLHAHLNSPDPEPNQMLPRGLFTSMNFTEEDFKAAEWHPSAEDLAGV